MAHWLSIEAHRDFVLAEFAAEADAEVATAMTLLGMRPWLAALLLTR